MYMTMKQIPYCKIRILRHELSHLSCPLSTAPRNIISSHSWKVDLSSKDEFAEVVPKMRATVPETFSFEDPSMTEHGDVIDDWE